MEGALLSRSVLGDSSANGTEECTGRASEMWPSTGKVVGLQPWIRAKVKGRERSAGSPYSVEDLGGRGLNSS